MPRVCCCSAPWPRAPRTPDPADTTATADPARAGTADAAMADPARAGTADAAMADAAMAEATAAATNPGECRRCSWSRFSSHPKLRANWQDSPMQFSADRAILKPAEKPKAMTGRWRR